MQTPYVNYVGYEPIPVRYWVAGSEPSQHHEANALMEAKAYVFTTKNEDMSHHFATQWIQIPNFAYDFSILEDSRQLSDTTDGRFLFPLYVLEVGFRLDGLQSHTKGSPSSKFALSTPSFGVRSRLKSPRHFNYQLEWVYLKP
ncbi:hypothetical protein J1N35_022739 [Gossypium stocksii]|uniref:Uncharacterized protein n=1 Tax=Gossypium stocksii TaxID=47602 RepID=A0A9D3VH81_9ROSI|nr:hypothetical protein J1N35_022739 [Gossypium stocksii]